MERVFASSGLADPEVDYGGDQSTRAVTLGGLLNVDYPLAPSHRISFNGLLNRVTEDQSRVLQGFNLDSNTDQRNTRIQYVENSLVQGRLSGKHYFNAFGGTTVEWKGAYSRAGRYEPNTREVLYRESGGVFLWDNFIQSGSIFHQDLTEDAINLNLDVQFPIRVNGQAGTIEVGASSLSRDRDVLSRRFRFLPNRSIPDEVKAASPDAIFTPENIGPGPRQFEIQEATFRPDNYVADQTTTGAYVMADFELLPRLRFAGGARIERSKQAVTPLDIFTRGAAPLTGAALDNTDFVPGATITWAASDLVNIRAAASRTLARPEFRELAPFSFADFAGGYLVVGNPVLQRSRITNFDLRWEWFPRPGAAIAVSGFYKKFKDPIEEVVFPRRGGRPRLARTAAATTTDDDAVGRDHAIHGAGSRSHISHSGDHHRRGRRDAHDPGRNAPSGRRELHGVRPHRPAGWPTGRPGYGAGADRVHEFEPRRSPPSRRLGRGRPQRPLELQLPLG